MSRSSVTKAAIDHLLLQGRILDAMNICSTTMTTSGVSDRSSYPINAMAESFLRAALVKARQEEMDPVEICRLLYTLHSFLSCWTKTFQLMSSSGTNRKHYDDRREHASFNYDDKKNNRSSSSKQQDPVRRQISSQDSLVSMPRRQDPFLIHDTTTTLHPHASKVWHHSLASLFSEELEAVFGRTDNSGLGQQVRQLFEV